MSLSDTSIGVVREIHEDDIFSPTVEVLVPHDKEGLLDLRHTKENNKIEHSLNPLTEGKPYLSFI